MEGTILIVVLIHPLGLLRYVLYLSSLQPLAGKPVPASHLALTFSRLCEGASLPSVGLAVIWSFMFPRHSNVIFLTIKPD